MGLWDGEGIQSSGSWRWDCSWLCCFWVCEAWHSPWWFVHHFWGVGMLNFVPLCLQFPLKKNVHTFFFFSSLSILLDLCGFFLSLYGKDILDSLSESMMLILQSLESLLCSQSPYQLCFCAILVSHIFSLWAFEKQIKSICLDSQCSFHDILFDWCWVIFFFCLMFLLGLLGCTIWASSTK